ncbi:MAG TPA: DUF1259 domain-containing protein [Gemmatimonadales bacterium]|nr:DUF1259 domain-containing protein [Gemmatimonadales bacterium]
MRVAAIALLPLLAASPLLGQRGALQYPWEAVSSILESPGTAGEGFQRRAFPRRGLRVRVATVAIPPAFALGWWAGSCGGTERATMMTDLVVTTDELGPVLEELAGYAR